MEYDIRFCGTIDGRRIAWGTIGSGPPVLVGPGTASHLELDLTKGPNGPIYRALADAFTVVRYDRAGTGLSERKVDGQTPEMLRHELEAVADAAGLRRFAMVNMSAAGPPGIEYAIAHPDRVSRIVFYGTRAARPGIALPPEVQERIERLALIDAHLAARELIEHLMPTGGSREWVESMTDYLVQSDGTEGSRHMDNCPWHDQRPLLSQIAVPVLVVHRLGDRITPVGYGRQLASLIPNSRFVALEGDNHVPGSEAEALELATRFRDFLCEEPAAAPTSATTSGFRTILFTDVVSSTPLLTQLKDAKMREVMREHDAVMEQAVTSHSGRVIKTIGDAFMAEFLAPSEAIMAAIDAQRGIRDRFASGDVPLRVRIGINAGEPIAERGDLHGASVVIAKRLESVADTGGIVVSDVVRQAVAGKDFRFEDRGLVELKGFDEPVRAWTVAWE